MSDDRVFCRSCTCERCRRNYTDKFCSICCFESENAFINDLIANSFDDISNSSNHPPQHQAHSFESYNDNPNYGYPPQEAFVYNQNSCYEQNFVDNSQSPPQPQNETNSYELCGNDAHYGYDCPPHVLFVYNQDSCFNQDFVIIFHKLHQVFHNNTFVVRTAGDLIETPKVLLLAWDKFFEIQHAQPEDIHELLHKLLEDLKIINEELAEYINSPCWNRPAFYDDDDEYSIQYKEYLENSSNAITSVLPTEDLDNSLSMGDEHLSTIPETKSDEVIKSSLENLVPIPSESEGIFDDTCDVPFCDNSLPLDVLTNHFELFSDFNDDCTSSDDDYFEDIDYVEASPLDFKLVSLEEDSDYFFEKYDTSLSYSDNSLLEFETFSDHTKEISSGSATTYADNSLLEYDSFIFEIEPDQGELTSVVITDILGEPHVHVPNVVPTHPTLFLDSDFIPSDDSLGSGLEVSFPFITRNKIFDPGIFLEVQSKRFLSRDTFSISFIRNPLCPDCSDFEDSRARGFVHRPLERLSLACLYMGIRYPRSY
nr:hypothetical protein [Tanacetum cinerariifolium]